MQRLFLIVFVIVSGVTVMLQARTEEDLDVSCTVKTVTYKEIGDVKLVMKVYLPDEKMYVAPYPAIVFYFGGGWYRGNEDHFKRQAIYYAQKGYVCFTPDYRTKNRHGTTPFESLKDAKSAMRWVKTHIKEYNVDPTEIIAAGGSAGGHLAAACAYVKGLDEQTDDLSIDSVPCALILYNPVVDNSPEGYSYDRIKDQYPAFSPIHNISAPALPAIFMLGTKDKIVPVKTGQKFKKLTEENGGTCDLVLYDEQEHAFFNYKKSGAKYYYLTLEAVDNFLVKNKLLPNQKQNRQ